MSPPSTRSAPRAATRMAWMSLRPLGDAQVALHRAALLREAGHVEHADALAFEMRRHAEQRADRDHAGAADAGDDDVVGEAERPAASGSGSAGMPMLPGNWRPAPTSPFGRDRRARPVHRDEGRAEALEAGEILVAARLVDGALAAPFGLQRLHRDAVRLHAAVAAALADQLVDDHALVGIGERAALAAAALLRRAGLVVDQHRARRGFRRARAARRRARRGDGCSMPSGHSVPAGYFSGSSVTMTTRLAPSAATCARDLRHREAAVVRLAAGHGDRVVEQDLVGDVGAGGDRGADRHVAGMVVGAVADVLEHVRRAWRTAPRRSSWRPRRPSG